MVTVGVVGLHELPAVAGEVSGVLKANGEAIPEGVESSGMAWGVGSGTYT